MAGGILRVSALIAGTFWKGLADCAARHSDSSVANIR
jgi:hypothetical protein